MSNKEPSIEMVKDIGKNIINDMEHQPKPKSILKQKKVRINVPEDSPQKSTGNEIVEQNISQLYKFKIGDIGISGSTLYFACILLSIGLLYYFYKKPNSDSSDDIKNQ